MRTRFLDRAVVIKTPTDADSDEAAAALRHEYAVLQRFAGTGSSGIARAIEFHEALGAPALVLEDAGPSTLRDLRMPLEVGTFLDIGRALTDILARVHGGGIVHRDIQPANVVLDAEGRPTLVDFDLAVTGPESASPLPLELADSLPYVAPEQTGRMSCGVDHRSDLYSLGIVFYELLTGAPPFRAKDPLGIVHAHLARAPISASLVARRVPDQLSRIVDKLLAKMPEDRYQSALALAADLAEVQRQWQAGDVATFDLASLDLALKLPLPERLYGRERDLATLTGLLDRVGSEGAALVLVAGAAGVGKSTLVRALRNAALARDGRYLEGKCDLRKANLPYAALVEAIDVLVADIVAGPVVEREGWASRIRAALGPSARVLTDLAPRLVDIIGEPPPPPPLEPLDAKLRLQATVRAFLGVFTSKARPLVLLLDDLQWADASTVETLSALAADPDSAHLLLVGAFRADEIADSRAVLRLETELRAEDVSVTRIDLQPLSEVDVEHLLTDAVGPRDGDDVRRLAAIVHRKTAGNPFFVRQLLRELQKQGLVAFDSHRGGWTWDVRRIEDVAITDNVVDLLAKAIDDLPEAARQLLPIAACSGKVVDVRTLAAVTGSTEEAVNDALKAPLDEGLLGVDAALGPHTYRFAHDRVQQAAYSRLDEQQRREIHLRIGRHLLQRSSDVDPWIFDAADQMNLGAPLLASDDDRIALAQLDARAGRKAQRATAYDSALAYLCAGLAALPESSWEARHELAFSLHRDAAKCALVSGDHDLSRHLALDALEHAWSRCEKADIYNLLVVSATVRSAWDEALSRGLEGLRDLGFEGIPENIEEGIARERHAIDLLMRGRSIERLIDESVITDEGDDAVLRLLESIIHPVWSSDHKLFTYVSARSVRFILEHGNGPPSPTVFGTWALSLATRGQLEEADAFARLAVNLARRFGHRGQEAQATDMLAVFVLAWRHFDTVIPQLRHALSVALESGEVRTAAYVQAALIAHGFLAGQELDGLVREIDANMVFLLRTRNGAFSRYQLAYRQGIRALKGLTFERGRFDDDDFSEASYLVSVRQEPFTRCVYEIRRLATAYLFRDFVDAAAHADEAGRRAEFADAYVHAVELNVFSSLTFAALCDGVDPERKADLLGKVRQNQQIATRWLTAGATNVRSKHLLVEAELARLEGRAIDAADLYDAAIEAAAATRVIHEEALARELAGRHALRRGRALIGEGHLREARRLYAEWGASEKVRALEEEFPLLRLTTRTTAGTVEGGVDLVSVLRVARTLSTETELDQLLTRLLRACIEAAGAERAALLLEEDGELFVRASGSALETSVVERTPLREAQSVLAPLVEQVQETPRPLVIDDAARDLRVAGLDDTHDRTLKSLLVLPICRKGALVAILYCENGLVTHAFDPARVNVLELLSSQMASALQNGLLVEKLHAEVAERTRAFERVEEALRIREEFLSIAAHELNTPLTSLKLMVQALTHGKLPPAPENVHRGLSLAGRQIQRLTRLVDELLDVSRIRSGHLDLALEHIDLVDVARDAIDLLAPACRESGSTITLTAPEPVMGNWDRLRLEQVVSNLLSNAIKFGSGKPIDVVVAHAGGRASLTVKDRGIGIPPERVAHIFERFERAVSARSYGGLGLGLYIARAIVTALGGTIRVESALGEGTTFVVELPTTATS
ncbi:AAA family ATPase [Labilithrix luteola]|uniref:GAF domain-containing sensor histidine kinase n=1 Tax=Labilithrix luteola TaxID=1391654 RepID=UPI0014758985|nr:AAA family ATPase [Labilithrix luteola]